MKLKSKTEVPTKTAEVPKTAEPKTTKVPKTATKAPAAKVPKKTTKVPKTTEVPKTHAQLSEEAARRELEKIVQQEQVSCKLMFFVKICMNTFFLFYSLTLAIFQRQQRKASHLNRHQVKAEKMEM